MEKESEIVNTAKSHSAMRAAKTALLLSSLTSRRHNQEKEIKDQAIEDLKVEVVKERYKRKKLKMFNLVDFTILIVVFFALLTLFILFAV